MMKRSFLAVAAVLLVVVPLTPPATAEGECSAPDDNRCELWSSTWDSGRNETRRGAYPERPEDVAVHRNRLYTVGESHDGRADSDVFILKSDAATGDLLWSRRFSGGSRKRPFDRARSVAITPDGSTIYVAGTRRYDFEGHGDMLLAAFSARSGRTLWVRSVHKGRSGGVEAEVIPGTSGVFVTGSGRYDDLGRQVITARYSAGGKRIWKRHYGLAGRDGAEDLATDGGRVFVAASIEKGRHQVATTLAYDGRGNLLWAATPHEAEPGHLYAGELRLDAGRVYRFSITQELNQEQGAAVAAMDALDADTGEVLWSDITLNPKTGFVSGAELALSPDGEIAYAIGSPGELPADHFQHFLVRAYDAASGAILWTSDYDHPVGDVYLTDAVARAEGVVVGAILFPSIRRDMLTVAFSRDTGSVIWSARHNPSGAANAEVNGGTMGLGPDNIVIHAGDVYFGISQSGSGYGYNDVVIAAYR